MIDRQLLRGIVATWITEGSPEDEWIDGSDCDLVGTHSYESRSEAINQLAEERLIERPVDDFYESMVRPTALGVFEAIS